MKPPIPPSSAPEFSPRSANPWAGFLPSSERLPEFAGPGSARLSVSQGAKPRGRYGRPPPKTARTLSSRDGFSDAIADEVDIWPARRGVHLPLTAQQAPPPYALDGGLYAKPRLLQSIERYIDKEIAIVTAAEGNTESPSFAKLDVYRQAFQLLLEQFRVYKPLLWRIKHEYDNVLDYYVGHADLPDLRRQIELQKKIREEQLGILRSRHARDMDIIRKMLSAEKERSERLSEELTETQGRNKALEDHVKETQDAYKDLFEKQKTLHAQTKQLEQALRAKESKKDIDLGKIYAAEDKYDRLMKDFHETMDHLDELKKKYQALVPQHESLKEEFAKLKQHLEVTTRKNNMLVLKFQAQERKKRATGLLGNVTKEDDLVGDVSVPTEVTALTDLLPGLKKKIFGSDGQLKPMADIVDALKSEIKKLQTELKETQALVPWLEEEKRIEKETQENWFVCRGTGTDVPKYLRFQGKVRNRRLGKRELEQIIADFWTTREKMIEKQGMTEDIEEFFCTFLKKRYGISSMVAEMSYNIVDAVDRYQYDGDCFLFKQVIEGTLCESVFDDQMTMLRKLKRFFKKQDSLQNGGKSTGKLSRKDFLAAVRQYFPLKSEAEHLVLVKALGIDQPYPVINYSQIFEEDREGNQGKFIELVREQHVYDIIEYRNQIEAALRKAVPDELSLLTVRTVKDCLIHVDPALSAVDMADLIRTGFDRPKQRKSEKLADIPEDLEYSVNGFLANLRRKIFKRKTKKLEPDAKTVRERSEKVWADHFRIEEKHMRYLHEAFSNFDPENTGVVSKKSISAFVRYLVDYEPKNAQVVLALDRVHLGRPGSEEFSWEDLVDGSEALAMKKVIYIRTLVDNFRKYDTDHSGTIDRDEMRSLVRSTNKGPALSEEDLDEAMRFFDRGQTETTEIHLDEYVGLCLTLI